MYIRRTITPLVIALAMLFTRAAWALSGDLEGLHKANSTNFNASSPWTGVNLQDWKELDYIPARIALIGGPATNQLVSVTFPHFMNGIPGFQNLYFLSNSANMFYTQAPTLNSPAGVDDWSYTMRITVTNNQPVYIYFFARLAAGAHLNVGSSLHLDGEPSLSPLQIHKPGPGPGSPDLAITKRGPAGAAPGEVITYTITYTNKATGTNNTGTGVQLTDILPTRVTYVAGSANGGGTLAGDTLSWDITNLTARATGSVTYQVKVTTNAVFGQTFTNNALILSAEDDANLTDNRSRVVTTINVNRAPTANPDSYSVNEDGTLTITAPGVLSNDTDPENTALTAVIVTSTTNGSLTLNANGSFTYTPTANFNGTDTFTYKASDGTNLSSTATVTITVNPVNDAPVANNDSYNATEDTTLTVNAATGVLANDTDIDGNSLTAVLVSNPSHGTLTLNPDGSFIYTPGANYNGPDSFTYKANDGITNSGTATVSITVAPVNDAPVANNDSYSVQSDATLNVSAPGVLANDTDIENNPLTAAIVSQPTHGSVSLNSDGSFTYTPVTDYFGSDSFTYRANDGQLNSSAATVAITVLPNTISITNPPTDRTNCPGDTVTFSVGATGTALTYQWYFGGSIIAGATNSTLALSSITAANGGQYCVVVNGATGGPLTNCAQLVVNVTTAVTNPPTSRVVCPGENVNFYVGAVGTDLTYEWRFGGTVISAATSNMLVLNNVTSENAGTYTVITRGACGEPVTNTATLTVNQNVAIVSPATDKTSFVGSNVVFDVVATGTDVTYAWYFNGQLISTNSTLELSNLTTNRAGTYCVVASGACGAPQTNCVTLTIQNRAPVAQNDSYSVAEDATLNVSAPGVLANDSDIDGDTLNAVLVSGPSHGTLTLNGDGSFTYSPATNYNGADSFTYRASDGSLQSDVATVSITVTPVNDPPTGNDDGGNEGYSVLEDGTLTITAPGVLANDTDIDGDPLTSVLASNPSHGSVTLNADGSFTYTPAANYFGPDSFTYVVNDGTTNSAPATVRINVIPVNDAPTFAAGPNQRVNYNAGAQSVPNWAGTISAGLANESNQVVHFNVSNSSNALFAAQPAISADGTLTYTPIGTVFGVATITVTLQDDGGTANGGVDTSEVKTFTITLNGPPTVSIINPLNGTLFIGTNHFTVIANATDPDSVVTNVVIFQGTNVIGTFTEAPYYVVLSNVPPSTNAYAFTAIATDDLGLTATSSVASITVTQAPPVTALGPISLNAQTGLYEQVVRISNPTPENFLNGVRLYIRNVASPARVWNPTGTNSSGVPFVDLQAALPSGGVQTNIISYFVPNGAPIPNPSLLAEPRPYTPPSIPPPTLRLSGDAQTLGFNTLSNRVYYIQTSTNLVNWTTLPGAVIGSGGPVQVGAGAGGTMRFYRAVLLP